ncbi:hypothetical protein SLE2022_123460 [Rubroshorea leprosula]
MGFSLPNSLKDSPFPLVRIHRSTFFPKLVHFCNGTEPLFRSESFAFCTGLPVGTGEGQPTKPGIRRVNLRAEIKSSPLFGSVKEVVIRFGGTAPLLPRYKSYASACTLFVCGFAQQNRAMLYWNGY